MKKMNTQSSKILSSSFMVSSITNQMMSMFLQCDSIDLSSVIAIKHKDPDMPLLFTSDTGIIHHLKL